MLVRIYMPGLHLCQVTVKRISALLQVLGNQGGLSVPAVMVLPLRYSQPSGTI